MHKRPVEVARYDRICDVCLEIEEEFHDVLNILLSSTKLEQNYLMVYMNLARQPNHDLC